jgi:hypothetical protein
MVLSFADRQCRPLMKLLFVWVLLSAGVAALARKKGQSVAGFFLLSLLCSPLVGLIVVAIVRKSRPAPSPRHQP